MSRYLPMGVISLAGRAAKDGRVADSASTTLVGLSREQLDLRAGLPTKSERIDERTEPPSYQRKDPGNGGLNINLPVIGGGFTLDNTGDCRARFELRDDRVVALRYAGDDAIAGASHARCAPIVRTCVDDRTRTASR